MAHSPMLADECVAQALAAAARAGTILSRGSLSVGGKVARVNPDKCSACLTCARVCPYAVPVISRERVAFIDAASCQGCGTCVGQCPGKAISLPGFTDAQLDSMCAEVCVPT
jgi:heterodisulfide reductase subunit A-like polyferredoxin